MARKPKDEGLGLFEGRTVIGVEVIVRKTGDGLSEAVKVEPRLVQVGDEGYIVFAYKCVDLHFPAENRQNPAEGGVRRAQVLDAGVATFIDDDVVRDAIERQAEKNLRWREQNENKGRLEDGLLVMDHDEGKHAEGGRVEHCARCDEEAELEAAGK